ncbi:glycosyltransferase [Sphingomonas hankyongi]|uniref:Glycosyltransferase n=1 Tax=Sphingomonas hankyongi TaxID=2908209 RepID=A0ABT0S2S3_9SPHN|nr:glycosyltransferase [Sphingomonas hankyongi]MCL6730126.1 glycosyltransferase [Sphingomonas hankyongi]
MHIAYLTNAYPKVSHSFIRREIAALEQRGVEITRISIRRTKEQLPDPADAEELARTLVLLDGLGSALSLLGAVLLAAISHPLRFLKALGIAHEMNRAGGIGLVRHLAYLAEACALARILAQRGIEHIHAHFGTNPAAVARLARVISGTSYSMTVHGPDEFDAPRAYCLEGKIADARFTAAVSSFGRSQLMRWARLADWPRIEVVRCGVDRGFLDMEPGPPTAARRLVCVSRLSAQKGLPLLLEAARLLVEEENEFELRLVGDGELRGTLEEKIRTLGIEHRVKVLGWCSNAEVRAELSASRAMVLPSFAEGLPVVIMESLALGRPVIATAVAGISELVDTRCGWIIPAGSTEALTEAMRQALEAAPEQLVNLGQEGRRRVAALHDADANAGILLDRFAVPA